MAFTVRTKYIFKLLGSVELCKFVGYLIFFPYHSLKWTLDGATEFGRSVKMCSSGHFLLSIDIERASHNSSCLVALDLSEHVPPPLLIASKNPKRFN